MNASQFQELTMKQTVRCELQMRNLDVKLMRHAKHSGTAPAVLVVGVVQAHATRIIEWLRVQKGMKPGSRMMETEHLAELIVELGNALITDASKELPAKPVPPRPPPTSAPSSGTDVTP